MFASILTVMIQACIGFGTKLLLKLASEEMVAWAFFKIADAVVKSTTNPHDNEWLEKIRDTYYRADKPEQK
ncbi:TPA: hypothetical protein QHB43_001175 [Aeromonas hydrophila subsp. hydrophila]|nr:hypothetical protein [Aeromonas hydrophila subsp. hydrophila]